MVVPGGFSYGDYLRAGAIARFAPAMEAVAEFAAAGGPVLGICNGFQVLCEAGLLPGALLPNEGLRFVCRQVELEVVTPSTVATAGCEPGDALSIPVKHMSGRWFAPADLLDRLEASGQIVFRYAAGQNPNGSVARRRRGLQRARQRRRPDAAPRARGRPAHRLGRRPAAVRVASPPAGSPPRRELRSPAPARLAARPPAPFVVGVGRSGTTLLRLMLDAHPELAIPPETHFVPELIERADAARAPASWSTAIAAARTWDDFGLDAEAQLREAARGRPRSAPASLRAFYGLYAEARGQAALGRQDARLRQAHAADRGGRSPRRASST